MKTLIIKPIRLVALGLNILLLSGCLTAPVPEPVSSTTAKTEQVGAEQNTAQTISDDAEQRLKQAREISQKGELQQAIELTTQAIQMQQDYAEGYNFRAYLYGERGRFDLALLDAKKATELKPDVADYWGNLGWFQISNGKFAEGQKASEKALTLNPESMAWMVNLGHSYLLQGNKQAAYRYYEKTLPLIENEQSFQQGPLADFDLFINRGWKVNAARKAKVWMQTKYQPFTQADTWKASAANFFENHNYPKSLQLYQQSLAFNQKRRPTKAVDDWLLIANVYEKQKNYLMAESFNRKALIFAEKVLGFDSPSVAVSLNNLAALFLSLDRYAEAEPLFRRSLSIREKAFGHDHPEVAQSLNNLAVLLYSLGRYAEAEPLYRRALAIKEKTLGPEYPNVADEIEFLAQLMYSLRKYAEVEPLVRRSLAIREKAFGTEHPTVAKNINNLAVLLDEIGDYTVAEKLYRRALAIYEKTLGPESPPIADILNNLASMLRTLGRHVETESLSRRALAISEKTLGLEHPKVADNLSHLAEELVDFGRYAEAEQLIRRSLAIREKAFGPDHPEVAQSLKALAELFFRLTNYEEFETVCRRALAIKEKALGPENLDVAKLLDDMGIFYIYTNRSAEAEQVIRRSLVIKEKTLGSDHPTVSDTLHTLAGILDLLGRDAEAEQLYRRAIVIKKKALGPMNADVGFFLGNLALLLGESGDYSQAEVLSYKSLHIAFDSQGPELEMKVLYDLSTLFSQQEKIEAAILFGKQAVNTFQKQRGRNKGLAEGLQKSYLKGNQYIYNHLIDLLLQQGRLAEAQQVLLMLKEEEYDEFVRKDQKPNPQATQIAYTADEQHWLEPFLEIQNQLADRHEALEPILKQKPEQRSAEQNVELARLEALGKSLGQQLQKHLEALEEEFPRREDPNQRRSQTALGIATSASHIVQGLGEDTALLQTLVLDDHVWLLLTRADRLTAIPVDLNRADLNKNIETLRLVLSRPSLDPRPLAQQLYQQLLGPLENALSGVKTLMLSLDDKLRYIPFATLYDGQHYLAERFALSVFTDVTMDNMLDIPQKDWQIAGLGTSQAQPGFPALPAVEQELDHIVRVSDGKDSTGIYTGKTYLNQQFNLGQFQQAVKQGYQALHIASHFQLNSGNEQDAFLLLGDGTHLDLGQLRQADYPLTGIDLLTLSACNTASSGKGQGKEIDGLAAVAQKKGAKSVMASLWSVADCSTALFMQNFYRNRQQNHTKAKALQLTQVEFIQGQTEALDCHVQRDGQSKTETATSTTPMALKVYHPDPKHPYAHPYYWAPFILMGNWL